jgi:hypothetical protein
MKRMTIRPARASSRRGRKRKGLPRDGGATTWSLVVDACGAGASVDAVRAGESRSSPQPTVIAGSTASVASAIGTKRGAAGRLLRSITAASLDLPGNESTTAG